jgi:hypothetical protein
MNCTYQSFKDTVIGFFPLADCYFGVDTGMMLPYDGNASTEILP